MSKLEVDKIDPQSGTNLELGTSGDTVTIPTGVTLDASNATTTLPSTVVTTTGTQTLTNKSIAASQLTGTVATSNLGTGTADSTTFLRGDQTYASATPAADSITTSQLAYNPNSFRNIIINGDMSIAQRGTSFTGLTNGSSNYTVDRFKFNESGSMTSVFTFSQDTDVPSGQGFAKSLKIQNTTAGSGHNVIEAIQFIEAQNLQYLKFGTSSAENLTLSFWVKCSETGTGNVSIYNIDATRQIAKNYTINSANTWEKKTLSIPGDTSGSFNNDNGAGLGIYFALAASSGYNGGTPGSWGSYSDGLRGAGMTIDLTNSTSDNIYITGVQLEAGTSASEFEFLPYDVNLRRCQRYYYKRLSENPYGPGSQGMQIGSSNVMIQGYHPIVMRTAPSMSGSGWSIEYSGSSAVWSMGSTRTSTTAWSSENSFSGTDGNAAILYGNNNTAADITGDAEL